MNAKITRSITATLTGFGLAAGIFVGGIGLGAPAQANPPSDPGQCNMAMPSNPAPSANAPSMMTRAGALAQISPVAPGKNSAMDTACSAS